MSNETPQEPNEEKPEDTTPSEEEQEETLPAEQEKDDNLPSVPGSFITEMTTKILAGRPSSTPEEMYQSFEAVLKEAEQATTIAQVRKAITLFMVKTTKSFKGGGFDNWKDWCLGMTSYHQLSGSTKQLDRYVDGVQMFMVDFGFDEETFIEYGPSALGELAQGAKIKNREEAEHWLNLVKTNGMTAVREEMTRNRAILSKPVTPKQVDAPADAEEDEAPEPGATPDIPTSPATDEGVTTGPDVNVLDAEPIEPPKMEDDEDDPDDEFNLPDLGDENGIIDSGLIQVIEGEDDSGNPITTVQIFNGDKKSTPMKVFYFRECQVQELTEEEASIFRKEQARQKNNKEFRELGENG